ncbi:hypothetical protein B0O99DRAFT_85648 [Bisporella sp. PMI_857]|nr:hypothetical protein B0O99DRAFT_85648 [Bisporella sp. PMI_857]
MIRSGLLNGLLIVMLSGPRAKAIEERIWTSFNNSIGGNLYRAKPFALPCFSHFEGLPSVFNASACAEIQKNYASASFRIESYNGFIYNQDEICVADSQNQCLLDYNNPANPAAFTNISCNQGSVSDYYIEVHSPEDVIAALQFSRATGIRLSIKNSGHDFFGRNSGKGTFALWMRRFRDISHDKAFVPEGCVNMQPRDTITTGAGVNFDEVYRFADEHNVTFIGGYSPTVGTTGGWLQGGGHSVLSVVHGLGIDRVLEFKVITPDGVLRTANACVNPDLFWALRGGGGGTFGIVLSATHAVEPRMPLIVASIKYTQTTANVNEWIEILVNNSLRWATEGWGGHYLANNFICVTPLLSVQDAEKSMEIASSFALSNNGTVVVENLDSWYVFYSKYVIPNVARIARPQILNSRLIPDSLFATESGRAGLIALMNWMIEVGLTPYIPNTTPYLYSWTSNSTSSTTAWRGSVWHLSTGIAWGYNSTFAQRAASLKLLDQVAEKMHELVPNGGAYFNEANPWTKDWKEDWWSDNYETLLAIKKKYDPEELLSCWKCVGFEESSAVERFPCFQAFELGASTPA